MGECFIFYVFTFKMTLFSNNDHSLWPEREKTSSSLSLPEPLCNTATSDLILMRDFLIDN